MGQSPLDVKTPSIHTSLPIVGSCVDGSAGGCSARLSGTRITTATWHIHAYRIPSTVFIFSLLYSLHLHTLTPTDTPLEPPPSHQRKPLRNPLSACQSRQRTHLTPTLRLHLPSSLSFTFPFTFTLSLGLSTARQYHGMVLLSKWSYLDCFSVVAVGWPLFWYLAPPPPPFILPFLW